MRPLLDMVVQHVPGPKVDANGPLQMMVTSLEWSKYLGRIATGRIDCGQIAPGDRVVLARADGMLQPAEVVGVELFDKLGRAPAKLATAGDIVALVGLPDPEIGDTVACPNQPRPLQRIAVDEPTISMLFTINTSPLAGREGTYVTSRHLRERLYRELQSNVALRLEDTESRDAWNVSGRGVLHLAVLIEQMRREGYELSVGKPRVIEKQIDGRWHEPFELLVVDVPTTDVGTVMELVCGRRGQMQEMSTGSNGASRLEFSIPARGLIGLRTRVLNATRGEAMLDHRFEDYRPREGDIPRRANGVLVSQESGNVVAYAMWKLQERSEPLVSPGDQVYEGMIVAENARDSDMVVNPIRTKKLTNIRAAGTDDNILLKPVRELSLEAALEYIEDDEYVEITPKTIRLRKILLAEHQRRRARGA
jgi:GTP-binding protein